MIKILLLFIILLFLSACESELAPETIQQEDKQELSESTAASLEDVFGGSSDAIEEAVPPPPSFQ